MSEKNQQPTKSDLSNVHSARTKRAQAGIIFASEVVGQHVKGQRHAEQIIATIKAINPTGSELADALSLDVLRDTTPEQRAFCTGFLRVVQKRIERAA